MLRHGAKRPCVRGRRVAALAVLAAIAAVLFAAGCGSSTQSSQGPEQATAASWCMVKLGMTLPQVHSILGAADENYTRDERKPGKEPQLVYEIGSKRYSVFFDSTYHVTRVTTPPSTDCPSPAKGSPL